MANNPAFQDDPEVQEYEADVMVLKDKQAICENLKYILSVPDLCDVIFLVGTEQSPVYGLKAILSSRSRIFYHMFLVKEKEIRLAKAPKKLSFLKKLKQIGKVLKSKPLNQSQEPVSARKLTITCTLEEYDPNVFQRLMRYVHCGIVSVDVFSVIGLLNAAEHFGFESLQSACWEFALNCIRPDTVHDLIASANEYSNSKTTHLLLQRIHDISLSNPEALYCTPSRSCSMQDLSDCRQRSITTNGLLMRSVL